jgi:hypothetical protein
MALVKAADEIRIAIIFKSFRAKKINGLVVTSKTLANNLVDLVTSGRMVDVARGQRLAQRCLRQWCAFNEMHNKECSSTLITDFVNKQLCAKS